LTIRDSKALFRDEIMQKDFLTSLAKMPEPLFIKSFSGHLWYGNRSVSPLNFMHDVVTLRILICSSKHWQFFSALVPLWVGNILIVLQVNQLFYVQISNDFGEIVLVHFIIDYRDLKTATFDSENKMWIYFTFIPGAGCKTLDIASRSNF